MRFGFILCLSLLLASLQSCKEGCKDKSAINYDGHAKVDNGTCLYCTGSSTTDTGTYFFESQNAPNTSIPAFECIVISTNSGFNGNGCLQQGKQNGNQCNSNLQVVNLTTKNMSGFFSVEFSENNQEVWFFSAPFTLNLGKRGSGTDTFNFGIVDSLRCADITTGTLNLDQNSFNFF